MEEKKDWPIIGMTLEETAAALRVNPRTVQDMILRGDFPARKVGVGWRISPDAVNRWLENSKRPSIHEEVDGKTEYQHSPAGKWQFPTGPNHEP